MTSPEPRDAPLVRIAAGAVRGSWRRAGAADRSAAFLGIPFAKPPVGDLRLAAPVPPDPWEGELDATAYGATPQRGDQGITLIPEPSIPGPSTLNVNVYTPAPGDAAALLPVLVWIHGGAFVSGSPASPWYDGRAFARDGVVTVTISYRLGFDGFGAVAGAPSNRGVRDWLAALEWVRDNIAAFGGDPGRVTIAGQSAGGGAVLTLLGMPAAQSLFHQAWALSSALGDVPPERAKTHAAKLAHLAGVEPSREGFMRASERTLRNLQREAAATPRSGRLASLHAILEDGLEWGPMIDGDLLTGPTVAALRAGIGADKPLVLGATDDEFTMLADDARRALRAVPARAGLALLHVPPAVARAYLAANGPQRRKGTAAVLGRYATDVIFRSLVVRVAEARTDAARDAATAGGASAAATWAYRFSWVSPAKGWSCHCLDVPFFFDSLDAPGVTAIAGQSAPRALADALHGSAVAFVRGGDPGWTPWSTRRGATRVFGGEASRPDVDPDGYASVRALV
ncbi:carboxylesterase family protein [Microbacterium sp. BWT-B31]|uniref:carboxylesterase/lipase family protein n=1 Tax=Microbacterium sp. BWT-B31 TaxID=3232072 RepID=UPI003527EA68